MKTIDEALQKVFQNLSDDDIRRIRQFIKDLGIFATVWDPVLVFHFYLAVAAVIEEIRILEIGIKTLTREERERYEILLGI